MSKALEIGTKLVNFCKEGKNMEAINALYSDNIISIEAMEAPGSDSREAKGIEAIRGKGQWWVENHEVHSATINGPFPSGSGDRFCVHFSFEVTFKPDGNRYKMEEVGMYTVEGDKIVKEEFFYHMG